MTATPGSVLLDTCTLIWLANGDRMRPQAADAIVAAGLSGGILVSPVSAWELGLLARPRGRNHASGRNWAGEVHGDPADQMIVATARHLGIPVVTRDARILAYARRGHVAAIRC
jgi:PIN domain nuclease of toxin-antitoxin system